MSDVVSVSIDGISALVGNLASYSSEMKAAVQALLEQYGQDVYDDSQSVVPVRSGELKDSGHVDVGELQVDVVYDSDHAAPVELGHRTRSGSHVPAQPFLWPSFENRSQQLLSALKALAEG